MYLQDVNSIRNLCTHNVNRRKLQSGTVLVISTVSRRMECWSCTRGVSSARRRGRGCGGRCRCADASTPSATRGPRHRRAVWSRVRVMFSLMAVSLTSVVLRCFGDLQKACSILLLVDCIVVDGISCAFYYNVFTSIHRHFICLCLCCGACL